MVPAPGARPGETLASTIPDYFNKRLNMAAEVKRLNLEELGFSPAGEVIATPSERSVEALERAERQLIQRRKNIPEAQQLCIFNIIGQADDPEAVGQQLKQMLVERSIKYDRVFVQISKNRLIEIK
jgi:hypothetical protein